MATKDRGTIISNLTAIAGRVPRYLRLAVGLVRDREVPLLAKAPLLGGVAYAVSPFDLVPGIIPVVGQLDDLTVLLLALRATLQACPELVRQRHLQQAELTLAEVDADLGRVGATAGLLVAGTLGLAGRALGRGLSALAARRRRP